MSVLIEDITTYQKTKTAYEAYRKAKDKNGYQAVHECDVILHEVMAE